MNYFQSRLRDKIIQSDEDFKLYRYMHWDTKYLRQWREMLFKTLVKDQIKNFNKD